MVLGLAPPRLLPDVAERKPRGPGFGIQTGHSRGFISLPRVLLQPISGRRSNVQQSGIFERKLRVPDCSRLPSRATAGSIHALALSELTAHCDRTSELRSVSGGVLTAPWQQRCRLIRNLS